MLIPTVWQGFTTPVDVCYLCYEGLAVAYKFKCRYEMQTPTDDSSADLTSDEEDFLGFESISNDRNNNPSEWRLTNAAKPFVCETCNRAFKCKGQVEQHIDRHRTKRGQKRCKKCNLRFLCSSHYKDHVC